MLVNWCSVFKPWFPLSLTNILVSTLSMAQDQLPQTPPYSVAKEIQTQGQIQKSWGELLGWSIILFLILLAHISLFLLHTHTQNHVHTYLKGSFVPLSWTPKLLPIPLNLITSLFCQWFFAIMKTLLVLFFIENGIMQNWLNLQHKVYILL